MDRSQTEKSPKHCLGLLNMAEVVGFELTNGLTRCRFSRPVPSTTRPHLLVEKGHYSENKMCCNYFFGLSLLLIAN